MRRWFAALVAATILGQAVFNGGRVLLSWRVLDLGGDAAIIGWFTAAFSLVPLLIAIPAGRMVDGRKAPIVMHAGLLATIAAAALMAVSPSLWVLFLGYVLLGFAHMTTLIAAQGMVSHLRGTAAGLDSLFAYFTLGISIGQLVGIICAGLVVDLTSDVAGSVETTPALWCFAGVGVVALFIGWPTASAYRRFDHVDKQDKAHRADGAGSEVSHERNESRGGVRDILQRKTMSSAMAASISVIVAIDLLTAYMPVLGHELGLSISAVTIILAARAGMAVVSRALMPTVLKHANRNQVLKVMVALGAIPMFAMPWLHSEIALFIATGVCGLAWGFVMPMSMTWVSTIVPTFQRAQALSVRLMGNRLAQVLIPPVAGLGATAMGAGAIFVGCGVLMTGAAVGTVRALPMGKHRGDQNGHQS